MESTYIAFNVSICKLKSVHNFIFYFPKNIKTVLFKKRKAQKCKEIYVFIKNFKDLKRRSDLFLFKNMYMVFNEKKCKENYASVKNLRLVKRCVST